VTAARQVATVGGIGTLPAPGTSAALAALPAGYLLHWLGGVPLLFLATLAATAAGARACRAAALEPGGLDRGQIVIGAVVGLWIALLPLSLGLWAAGAPASLFPWPGWLLGFLFFRLFDIWKPWPVSSADRRPGATGLLLGPALAGLMAAVVVVLLAAVAHGWLMSGGAEGASQ
jgi:phosphatidylglycerophosphatase A